MKYLEAEDRARVFTRHASMSTLPAWARSASTTPRSAGGPAGASGSIDAGQTDDLIADAVACFAHGRG